METHMEAKKLNLYDKDYYGWIVENVSLLKAKRFNDVDLKNLIEELKDMGKSEKRSLESYLTNLISHRLKWDLQPNKRSNSWIGTINIARRKVTKLLEENPSFKNLAETLLQDAYVDGVYEAMSDTGLQESEFPGECPYKLNDLLNTSLSL
jgi:hypothetical protein